MPTNQPYIGGSHDRLTALINQDNGTQFTEGVDFTYGALKAITPVSGRNTTIVINPTDTENFSPVTVRYTRLSISVLANLPEGSLAVVQIPQIPFSIHSILDRINTALGLNLDPSEVVDVTYTQGQRTYPLTINSTSVAWVASSYNFLTDQGLFIDQQSGSPMLMQSGEPFELEAA